MNPKITDYEKEILFLFVDLIDKHGSGRAVHVIDVLKSCVSAKLVIESFKKTKQEKRKIFKRILEQYFAIRGAMKG